MQAGPAVRRRVGAAPAASAVAVQPLAHLRVAPSKRGNHRRRTAPQLSHSRAARGFAAASPSDPTRAAHIVHAAPWPTLRAMKPLTIIVEGNNRLPQTTAGHESDAGAAR